MKVLVTCPPMLSMMGELHSLFEAYGAEVHCPDLLQALSEAELVELVPDFDGWIIGDDPATRAVFEAGRTGRLRAAVKWGVGVDNVDFDAAHDLDVGVTNTPGVFGREVADVAMCYLTGLARNLFYIDREVRRGRWPKPRGVSLAGKTLALVGFGDIGRNMAARALAADMQVIAYDPDFVADPALPVERAQWPERVSETDFLVFTCALTKDNYHMLDAGVLPDLKPGVRVINVARGPLIEESALIEGLKSGTVHSAALDVMETEPLPADSALRACENCVLGSHNASNTSEAVWETSRRAVDLLFELLDNRRRSRT